MPPKTSGKSAAKSGKAAKAVTKGDKKKKKGKRKESYAIYIYSLLKCSSNVNCNMHCTQSQKDGQNYKSTNVRRAILPKCPSRRANPSLDGRLGHTGDDGYDGNLF